MFLGYWLKFFCRLLLYFALPPTIMIIVLVVSIVFGWLESSAMKIKALWKILRVHSRSSNLYLRMMEALTVSLISGTVLAKQTTLCDDKQGVECLQALSKMLVSKSLRRKTIWKHTGIGTFNFLPNRTSSPTRTSTSVGLPDSTSTRILGRSVLVGLLAIAAVRWSMPLAVSSVKTGPLSVGGNKAFPTAQASFSIS